MEVFHAHRQKLVCFFLFLTTQNHQPEMQYYIILYKFQKLHYLCISINVSEKWSFAYINLENLCLCSKDNQFLVEITLHTGLLGSPKLTSKLSHFKSKCTMFLRCKYSIPKAASSAIITFLLRSSVFLGCFNLMILVS